MKRYVGALVALFVLVGAVIGAAPAGASTSDDVWQYVDVPVRGTYMPLVGNFDGNETTDILWYTPDKSSDSLWLFRPGTRQEHVTVPESIASPHVPIVGNFAGDWRDDILWYTPGAAPDPLWIASDTRTRFTSRLLHVAGSYRPVVLHDRRTDVTHDDIVWAAPGASTVSIWDFDDVGTRVDTGYRSVTQTVRAGTSPTVGDWDRNGMDDLLWYGPGSVRDALWRNRGSGRFERSTISVGGSYEPVTVGGYGLRSGPYGDSILWWGDGTARDGYWQNTVDGFQSRSFPTTTATGTPFALFDGTALIHVPDGLEQHFWDFGNSLSLGDASRTGVDIADGSKPLVGDFDGDVIADDVFWYGAGDRPDQLWYFTWGELDDPEGSLPVG